MKASRAEACGSLHAGFDYRRLASPCADGETPRAVVVLHDERDGPIVRGLEALRALSAQGTIKPLLVACATKSGLKVTRVADGVSTADDLFDALHRAGRIDRLDIVTVFSETLDDHAGSDLADAASELVRLSRRLAGAGASVWDHRVSVSSYDSLGTAAFSGTPDTRVVVIAEDRRSPSAMARPLDASDLEEFGPHAAAEIASLCGLWETVDGAALELIRATASGTGSPLVVLARSFVRTARLSHPSPAEAMQRGESLPVPDGAMRTPVPEAVTDHVVGLLHPQDLRWQPHHSAPPDSVGGPSFWRGFGARLLSDLRRFPSRLRNRGRSEMSAAFDEMAAGWRSETPWLFASDVAAGEADSAGGPVCGQGPRPVEVFVPDVWADLVQSILGVADYSEHARRVRQDASGDERHLLVSKRYLASVPEGAAEAGDDPGSVYRWLGGEEAMQPRTCWESSSADAPEASDPASPRPEPVTDSLDSVDEREPAANGGPAGGIESAGEVEFTEDLGPSVRVDPAMGAASSQGGGTDSNDELLQHRAVGEPSDPRPFGWDDGDLLQRLTAEFDQHKGRADRALHECHQRMAETGSVWRDRLRPDIEMSRAVPYLLAYGILLALLCWTVLPGWDVLQTDIVENSWWLSRVWVSVTTALALSLLVLNMPRETKRRQIHLIVGTATLLGAASWLLLADGPVRSLLEADVTALAPLLIVVLVALMAVSVWLMIGRDSTTSALRLSAVLMLMYVTAVAVAVLNDANFTEQIGFLRSGGYRLIVVLSVVAGCLVLASFAVVSILHYRHTLDLKCRRDEVQELASWHHAAHREAERLASVLPHWLGAALALHRIIRLPYGALHEPSTAGGRRFVGDGAGSLWNASSGESGTERGLSAQPDRMRRSVLMKSVFCVLEATDRGHETFRRLLQSDLARPGWLYAQYRRAAEAYRASLDTLGPVGLAGRGWPNACAYPYPADENVLETVNGDRWPFVQRLYRGDFDPVLRERVEAFAAGDGLDELFDEIESFRVAFGTHPDEAPRDLFAEIALDPDPEIPQGILGGMSLNISHEERQMQSCLWWPQRLTVPSGSEPHARSRSLRLGDSVVHQAVRVDLSVPISLTALTGASARGLAVADSGAGHAVGPDNAEMLEPLF